MQEVYISQQDMHPDSGQGMAKPNSLRWKPAELAELARFKALSHDAW